MPQDNSKIVKRYHEKLTTIRVRVPAKDDEAGIPDVLELNKITKHTKIKIKRRITNYERKQ